MKKIFSCALTLALSLMFSVFAFAYENTVDDYAMLFTQEESVGILAKAESFSEATGYSLAVLTIDYAQGHASEEYADDYHDNLIDSEGWSENSMLFLVDMDNRNVWISTTGEAIYTYDDYTIDYIINSGYNELSNGEYAQAILLMIETAQNEAVYSENEGEVVEEHYYYFPENNFDDNYYYSDYDYGKNSFDFSDVLVYIVIGLVIAAITVFVVKSKYKNYGKGDEFDEDDMSLNLTGSTDNVISRNVVTTRIPRNNNHGRPGGGGHHGGSSVHRSSGGRSHGGGGRSF